MVGPCSSRRAGRYRSPDPRQCEFNPVPSQRERCPLRTPTPDGP
jgi:hypothetical protein